MVDTSSFKVSRNLAVTPGAVVLRTEVLELIQYRPQTAQVREVPLLIVPPTINKCYAMDLTPGRSLVEYLVQNGQQTFVISWHNPDARDADWGLDTYAGITCRCAAKCRRTWRPGSRQENLTSWLHGSLQKLHPASQRSARRQPSAPLSLEHREIAAAGVLREAPPQIAATGNLGARQRAG
jgi:hypothetical protein